MNDKALLAAANWSEGGPAFGQPLDRGVLFAPGLTRLEYTAIQVFAALHGSGLKLPGDRMADYAVAQAKVVLARLESEVRS